MEDVEPSTEQEDVPLTNASEAASPPPEAPEVSTSTLRDLCLKMERPGLQEIRDAFLPVR